MKKPDFNIKPTGRMRTVNFEVGGSKKDLRICLPCRYWWVFSSAWPSEQAVVRARDLRILEGLPSLLDSMGLIGM